MILVLWIVAGWASLLLTVMSPRVTPAAWWISLRAMRVRAFLQRRFSVEWDNGLWVGFRRSKRSAVLEAALTPGHVLRIDLARAYDRAFAVGEDIAENSRARQALTEDLADELLLMSIEASLSRREAAVLHEVADRLRALGQGGAR